MPLFGVSWADRRLAVKGRLGCIWSPELRTITNVSTMLPRPFQDLWEIYIFFSTLKQRRAFGAEILTYFNISTGTLIRNKLRFFSIAALILITRKQMIYNNACKKSVFIPSYWSHYELNVAYSSMQHNAVLHKRSSNCFLCFVSCNLFICEFRHCYKTNIMTRFNTIDMFQ